MRTWVQILADCYGADMNQPKTEGVRYCIIRWGDMNPDTDDISYAGQSYVVYPADVLLSDVEEQFSDGHVEARAADQVEAEAVSFGDLAFNPRFIVMSDHAGELRTFQLVGGGQAQKLDNELTDWSVDR